MIRKMVNRPEPTSLLQKAEHGVELFGQLKCAYDVGRGLYNVARVAAPYVASAARMLV